MHPLRASLDQHSLNQGLGSPERIEESQAGHRHRHVYCTGHFAQTYHDLLKEAGNVVEVAAAVGVGSAVDEEAWRWHLACQWAGLNGSIVYDEKYGLVYLKQSHWVHHWELV